ncbi:hypothetical protein CHARACLAT_004781 [Characodon lateralis]|uniref:Uncharacterized protein n=1 Tax=Characodon lateralis TaxID=208331 RepID=A0ABU7E1S5_9TELE|nr:hypothetical protein [Characodon lateralis]
MHSSGLATKSPYLILIGLVNKPVFGLQQVRECLKPQSDPKGSLLRKWRGTDVLSTLQKLLMALLRLPQKDSLNIIELEERGMIKGVNDSQKVFHFPLEFSVNRNCSLISVCHKPQRK